MLRNTMEAAQRCLKALRVNQEPLFMLEAAKQDLHLLKMFLCQAEVGGRMGAMVSGMGMGMYAEGGGGVVAWWVGHGFMRAPVARAACAFVLLVCVVRARVARVVGT
jgi:hypothetical protein